MLSSSDLSYMRDAIEQLLPDTCNILTVTETADGFGGVTQTWGTATGGTAVPCRLDIVRNRQSMNGVDGASMREYQETVLSLPYDTTIGDNYRIEHGGYTYNVTSTNNDQSWIAVKRVVLERV